MKASINCIELIKQFEGLRLKPYLCPANVPTIGYGSTRYAARRPVRMNDPAITEAQATELLIKDVERFAEGVDRLVKFLLNQNQFDALVSFAYNVGLGAFGQSTLLQLLNIGKANDPATANQFNRWTMANGKVSNGLINRRAAERNLYLKKD